MELTHFQHCRALSTFCLDHKFDFNHKKCLICLRVKPHCCFIFPTWQPINFLGKRISGGVVYVNDRVNGIREWALYCGGIELVMFVYVRHEMLIHSRWFSIDDCAKI